MLKRSIKFLIFFILVMAITYTGANLLIDIFSDLLIKHLAARLQTPGLEFNEPSFESARISSYHAIAWKNIDFTATLFSGSPPKQSRKARVKVEQLTVEAVDLFDGFYLIKMNGLNIKLEYPEEGTIPQQRAPTLLQDGRLAARIQTNIFSRAETLSRLRKFAAELKQLADEGQTTLPVSFSAEEIITLEDGTFSLGVRVEKNGGIYRLMADKDDLVFISQNILPESQTSTPADIQIIAENPLRAPQLLRIRSKTAKTARDAHEKNPRVPEDAYRHVLWSYLLTREYGIDFARKVTDAHEIEAGMRQSPARYKDPFHRQDHINNEIGRKYAQQGYDESKILNLVLTDPAISVGD